MAVQLPRLLSNSLSLSEYYQHLACYMSIASVVDSRLKLDIRLPCQSSCQSRRMDETRICTQIICIGQTAVAIDSFLDIM